MNDHWEYKVIYCSAELRTEVGLPDDLNKRFDGEGAQGWELTGTDTINRPSFFPWGGAQTVRLVAFFKRRVQS